MSIYLTSSLQTSPHPQPPTPLPPPSLRPTTVPSSFLPTLLFHQFCLQVLLGIHWNSKKKEFFRPSEGLLDTFGKKMFKFHEGVKKCHFSERAGMAVPC